MSADTKIEWTDRTWNPVTGCTKVSPGCDHCYAETIAERFRGGPAFPNGFDVQLRGHKLTEPLRWRKPSNVFVNSMSDLFHDSVPDEYIAKVFAVMASAPRHTFQILTKRHGRMRSLVSSDAFRQSVQRRIPHAGADSYVGKHYSTWPLPNVWLGVSTENQQWADIRIPALLGTPAAVRFISAEPLLGPVDLIQSLGIHDVPPRTGLVRPQLDWVIVGGESGPKARPMHPDWARSLRDQCVDAGMPFHFKQWGEYMVNGYYSPETGIPPSPEIAMEPANSNFGPLMLRVGKKRAGRVLDGRTWDEFPEDAS